MTTAAWKRRERAREKLRNAVLHAVSVGLPEQEIRAIAASKPWPILAPARELNVIAEPTAQKDFA